jgi:hypothetical protein
MAHRLPASLADVDANVVILAANAGVDVPAELGHERLDGRLLHRAEREEVGFVAARNDQRMTASAEHR